MCDNACGRFQGSGKFGQGDVTILCNQFFEKRLLSRKLALAAWASLIFRLNGSRFAQFTLPAHARSTLLQCTVENALEVLTIMLLT